MQYFEWNLPNDGKLWTQLKEDARHLHDVGVTSVWIPPAYKADEQQDEGYAVYDLYDLGEFDQKGTVRTKYGTRQELEEAIAALHANGISVYIDTVMNQKTGADYTEKFMACEVDPENREQVIGAPVEVEGWTGYTFPGRGDKYSPFKWHWYHFSGTDQVYETGKRAIYLIQGEGKKWSEGVDGENGNYDFLIFNDVDFDHPEVIEEMKRWGAWIAQTLDADGMRLDALKHIRNTFIGEFMHSVRASRGKEFYAVGEYWSGDFESLEAYLDAVDHQIDLFDAPLHFKLFTASQQGRDFDLRTLLDDTLVRKYPTLAVTFVDNHDSQRGSSLESQVKSWFKPLAYGLILLMKEGYPCIFYGDYYSMKGEASPHRAVLDILLDARRSRAFGEQTDYFDHPNTVGFTRAGDEQHPDSGLALLLSNGEDGEKVMSVGVTHANETWHEITGSYDDEIVIGDDGKALFRVHGGKLAVWVKKKCVPYRPKQPKERPAGPEWYTFCILSEQRRILRQQCGVTNLLSAERFFRHERQHNVKLNSLSVMKESTNKTAGRTQTGQNKSATKSSRTTTSHASSTSRGTAKSQSSATGRVSRSNNPEGHNQYTKKSQGNC